MIVSSIVDLKFARQLTYMCLLTQWTVKNGEKITGKKITGFNSEVKMQELSGINSAIQKRNKFL